MPFDDKGFHYVASALKPDREKDISLEKDVAQSGARLLRRHPRTRLTQDNRLLPQSITKTDAEAENRLQTVYCGGKKPALVLNFIETDTGYRVGLGTVEIHVQEFGYAFKAYLVKKSVVKNKTRWRQLLSAEPGDTPTNAVKHLTHREGWFYDQIEWRSLEWVFKSVVVVGLGRNPILPKSHVTGIKQGNNLHVLGTWKWERVRIEVIRRSIDPLRAPDRRAQRYKLHQEPMPAMRSAENYKQDYDELGTVDGRLKENRLTKALHLEYRKPAKLKFVAGERVLGRGMPKPIDPPEWTGVIKGNSF